MLLTLTRHRFAPGVNTFQVPSQCQPAHAALMREVHAPPKHHLSLKKRLGLFLIYTLLNTSRVFKCSLSQAAAAAATTKSASEMFICLMKQQHRSGNFYPHLTVFLKSIQGFLIHTWAVPPGLSPHRSIKACWLRIINLPNDLHSLLEIFGIKQVMSLLQSWKLYQGQFWETATIRNAAWNYPLALNRCLGRLSDGINVVLGWNATGHCCSHR